MCTVLASSSYSRFDRQKKNKGFYERSSHVQFRFSLAAALWDLRCKVQSGIDNKAHEKQASKNPPHGSPWNHHKYFLARALWQLADVAILVRVGKSLTQNPTFQLQRDLDPWSGRRPTHFEAPYKRNWGFILSLLYRSTHAPSSSFALLPPFSVISRQNSCKVWLNSADLSRAPSIRITNLKPSFSVKTKRLDFGFWELRVDRIKEGLAK